MAALRSNGQAFMFYLCDLLFIIYLLFIFSRSNLRGRRTPPCGTFARMSECGVNFITQIRWRSYLYTLHCEGRKSANFAPQLGDGAAMNSCNLKTRLQIEKLKQMCYTSLTITPRFRTRRSCSRWERHTIFRPKVTPTFAHVPGPNHITDLYAVWFIGCQSRVVAFLDKLYK